MHAPPLPILSPQLRASLAEHTARLKHDLGKYVALQQRWLGEGASAADQVEALRADLLSTRRSPKGHQDAVAVWAEFAPELCGERAFPDGTIDLSSDPDVAALSSAMAFIANGLDALREPEIDPELQHALRDAAFQVAASCRQLAKRARTPEAEWPISS